MLILSLSLYSLQSFLKIDAQALKHPRLAFVGDLSNNDSLAPENGTGFVEAVAAPAGKWICTDCSHLNLLRSKFCELSPSAD
jgi:hypothetical protein